MSSPQVQHLKNIIELAKEGREGAIGLLRDICVSAAKNAPTNDIITMGLCLVDIGDRLTQIEVEKN